MCPCSSRVPSHANTFAIFPQSRSRMPIHHAHSFLVHPGKGKELVREPSGASVPRSSRVFDLLSRIYDEAETENRIEVIFRNEDGTQKNARRTQILRYLGDPTLPHARRIAAELHAVTTERSRLGLLFFVEGLEGSARKLLIARFPADQGVMASERGGTLDIRFIERVFMKSAFAYKSVLYAGRSLTGDFWDGRAVDKQINGPLETSQYWINDFLLSDFRTTDAAGTKRLASALRTAVQQAENLEIRSELVAAAQLLRGRGSRVTSLASVASDFGLSDSASETLRQALPRPEHFDESFRFDPDEFAAQVPFRTVEIDNGGMMLGDAERFDEIFRREEGPRGRVRFTTEGRIVDERLRKKK